MLPAQGGGLFPPCMWWTDQSLESNFGGHPSRGPHALVGSRAQVHLSAVAVCEMLTFRRQGLEFPPSELAGSSIRWLYWTGPLLLNSLGAGAESGKTSELRPGPVWVILAINFASPCAGHQYCVRNNVSHAKLYNSSVSCIFATVRESQSDPHWGCRTLQHPCGST